MEEHETNDINMETFSEAVLLSHECGRYKGQDYIDIIAGLCEDYGVDPEDAVTLISPKIKRLLTVQESVKHTIEVKPHANPLW